MKVRRALIPHPSALILFLVVACAKSAQPPPRVVHRVVSLAPNVTEMLFAVDCGAKVVGTDNFSDYPAAAARLPHVGGVEPDIEKIVALRPELVIASASNAHPNLRRALAAVHIPLLVIRTDRLDDIPAGMATIAQSAGCDATRAVAAFKRSIDTNRRTRVRLPRVLLAVWTDPLYVAGKQTFIDDLYGVTGSRNAADVTGWPTYSLESFIAQPPDVLVYPNRSVTPDAVRVLLGRAHVSTEAAPVDENVFTRPGPRLADAATALNGVLDRWERGH